ncbi:MAG: hypothetical protein WCE63_14940 [Acidobacteriaceae bacterium]
MKIEQFRQRAGVTEKYVPGAGATPSRWDCRVGLRHAGRSRSGLRAIQKISVADTGPIRAGYERDRLLIQFVSGNCPRSIAKNL